MNLSREFVSYMTKRALDQLVNQHLIEYEQPEYVVEVVTQLLWEEIGVEDQLNEEVRKILREQSAEMQRMGASYDEMFKKVKNHLVRERKLIL